MQSLTTKRLLQRLLVLVLTTVSFWSCNSIYDDLSECRMFLQFKYDYNMARTDKFPEECDNLEVFLFDADGVLFKLITDSGDALKQPGYQIEVPIHSGDYTVMAWVGRKGSYDLTDMTVGTSTKEDLILKLKSFAKENNTMLEPLWCGMPLDFTYTGGAHHVETIDLMKLTNTVNLNISGYETGSVALDDLEVKLTAANSSYLYNCAFADTNVITYLPYSSSTDSIMENTENLLYSLSTLRFVKGQNVRFSVIDKATGESLLPTDDIDLIEYLLMTKPSNMTEQEYLDRQDTWNIQILSSHLSVTLIINGWIVWSQGGEL